MAADRKVFNTDSMEQLTRMLHRLSADLEDCAVSLASINPQKAAGGEVDLATFFCRLWCIDSVAGGDQVHALLARLSTMMREEADYADHLGDQFRRAAELVADTEQHMANTPFQAGNAADYAQKSGTAAAGMADHASSVFVDGAWDRENAGNPGILASEGSQAVAALGQGLAVMLDGATIAMMRRGAQGATYALAGGVVQSSVRAISAAVQPSVGVMAEASSRFGAVLSDLGCAIGHASTAAQWATPAMSGAAAAGRYAASGAASTVLQLAESCLYDLIDGV